MQLDKLRERHDDAFPAILSTDASEPPIKGPALIVRERGDNLFIEHVNDPTWKTLLPVASRAIFHNSDPDHCFLEMMTPASPELAAAARREADSRGISPTESVWEFFFGS